MTTHTLTFETALPVSAETAWKWIISVDGITREMAPYLRMSVPEGVTSLASVSLIPAQRLFRSWILLGGVLPIDYSDLRLLSIDEGVGFVEESPMGSMKLWRHERRIVASTTASGCTVRDQLTFEPRVAGWLVSRVVRAFFAHRHRMLARYLGREVRKG